MEEGERRVDTHVSELTIQALVMPAARDGKVGLLVHHFWSRWKYLNKNGKDHNEVW